MISKYYEQKTSDHIKSRNKISDIKDRINNI